MTRRLFGVVARALRETQADAHVHFHQGSHGQPAACYDPHCGRPHLDAC
ncbi:MAG TPA: hypothetical protein VII98_15595 [Solirubrobacteraceae bacterium]